MGAAEALVVVRVRAAEAVRLDWLADHALALATDAGEELQCAQAAAESAGCDRAMVRRASCWQVVVDVRDEHVEVLPADQLEQWHRKLWPSVQAAQDDLAEQAPELMDPEVVAERIAVHCRAQASWGGVWLDCTLAQLRHDLAQHYVMATTGFGCAS